MQAATAGAASQPTMPVVAADLDHFFTALEAATRACGAVSSLDRPVVLAFSLGEAGVWVLRASPTEPGSLERATEPGAADCTVACELPILLDLFNGRRKPAAAFMRGLVRISGPWFGL